MILHLINLFIFLNYTHHTFGHASIFLNIMYQSIEKITNFKNECRNYLGILKDLIYLYLLLEEIPMTYV
jgi:hypothetical protein